MKTMKEMYNKLDFGLCIWWLFLIFLFLIVPNYLIYSKTVTDLHTGKEIIEKPIWLYFVGTFIWDWIVIIWFVALGMIGMILTKLHNHLTKK